VIRTLCSARFRHEQAGVSDAQLLENYLRVREEAAFAALVHRHGPMVWGVCRRVLRNHEDAEDAFQATFLVLVRKAESIRSRERVGNWLYGVAYQTARRARTMAARRARRERQTAVLPEPAVEPQSPWHDWLPLLDQELSCLPEKYRTVIVLCDLEGKTRKEAAQLCRLPEGTVASRLATARALLAKRLARQGVGLSAGALALLLSQQVTAAAMPASVAANTITAGGCFAAGQTAAGGVSVKAAALAKGVLQTMFLNQLKFTVALLAAALTIGLAGLAAHSLGHPPLPAAQVLDRSAEKPTPDQEAIQGTWTYVSCLVGGKSVWNADAPPKSITFAGDRARFVMQNGDGKEVVFHARFQLRPSRTPREIDLTDLDVKEKGKTTECLYELSPDTLKLCHADRPDEGRPRTLESRAGSTHWVWTLRRQAKPEKEKPAEKGKIEAREPPNLAERLGRLPDELLKAKKTDAEIIDACYLATLARFPEKKEREHLSKFLKDAANRAEGCRDVLWALVNSSEFLKLHGIPENPAAGEARAFFEKLEKSLKK
jgi:RNA polymerase sigma factor (sigma-70 family)